MKEKHLRKLGFVKVHDQDYYYYVLEFRKMYLISSDNQASDSIGGWTVITNCSSFSFREVKPLKKFVKILKRHEVQVRN